jgi:VWFA-related protein
VAVPFTTDAAAISEAAKAATAGGGTALLDAMALGFSQSRSLKDGRRHALVMFTDGGDRNSRMDWRDIRSMAREANTRVYPFLLWSASDEFAVEQGELRGIADDSGGRIFPVEKGRQLQEEVSKLELHQQYVLGFVPGYHERDGRFRHVKVELRDAPGHLKLYWKHGYFTPIE